jgi:hypothetical protein
VPHGLFLILKVLVSLIITGTAAAEIVVSKIQGNKAIVIIRGEENIQEGTLLYFSQEKADAALQKKMQTNDSLQSRHHQLSWFLDTGNNKEDQTIVNSGSSSLTEYKNVGESRLAYLYNWGRYALGGELVYSYENSDLSNQKISQPGLLARYHFVEDLPGAIIVPYVGIGLGQFSETESSGISLSGKYNKFFAGFSWYPFNEIFALHFNVAQSNLDYSGSSETSSFKYRTQRVALIVGWSIVF